MIKPAHAVSGRTTHRTGMEFNDADSCRATRGRPSFKEILGRAAEINPAGRTKGWARSRTEAPDVAQEPVAPLMDLGGEA
jgi:hypothetical protein